MVGKLRRLRGGGLERRRRSRPLTATTGAEAANFEILRKGMFVSDQPESSSESHLLSPPVIFSPRRLGLRSSSCSCSCSCIRDQVGKLALVGRRWKNIRRGSYQGSDCHVILQQGTNQQVQDTQENNMRTTGGLKLSLFYLWLQVTEIPVKMMIEVGNLTN